MVDGPGVPPKADAVPRRNSACTPRSLGRAIAGDGLECQEAPARTILGLTNKARINNKPNAWHGKRGFRNIGTQDNPRPAAGGEDSSLLFHA